MYTLTPTPGAARGISQLPSSASFVGKFAGVVGKFFGVEEPFVGMDSVQEPDRDRGNCIAEECCD